MKIDHFLKLAIRAAFQSQSKFRHGAVLVKKNRVINTAVNRMDKSHPIQQKYSRKNEPIGSHAELRCCLGISYPELNRSTLFVARVLRNGNPALSKPCLGCQDILIDIGIRRVYYTVNSNRFEYMEF